VIYQAFNQINEASDKLFLVQVGGQQPVFEIQHFPVVNEASGFR
jgi:hypothetical protein